MSSCWTIWKIRLLQLGKMMKVKPGVSLYAFVVLIFVLAGIRSRL